MRKTGTTGVSQIMYKNPAGVVFLSKPKVADSFNLKVNDGNIAPATSQAGGDVDQGGDGEPSAKRPRDDGALQQDGAVAAGADGAPVGLKAALATKHYLQGSERPKERSHDGARIFLQIDRPVSLPAGWQVPSGHEQPHARAGRGAVPRRCLAARSYSKV